MYNQTFLQNLQSFLESIIKSLFLIVSYIFILLSLPFLILFTLPILLWRKFVAFLALKWKPSLGKMLTTRSTLFAADDFYTKPQKNLLIGITLEGNLSLEFLRNLVQKNLIEGETPQGELKYPELRQKLSNWCGFTFWEDVETFDLKEHVKLYNGEIHQRNILDAKCLNEIRQNLVTKAWKKGQPLWEMVIVHNIQPPPTLTTSETPYSSLLIRCHHSLGDGYSWLNLLIISLAENTPNIPTPVKMFGDRTKSIFSQGVSLIRMLFGLILDWARIFELSFLRKLRWRVNDDLRTGDFNVELCDLIPLKVIKEIKNNVGVTFTSVVFAVLAGALSDMLEIQGEEIKRNEKLNVLTALPLLGHSHEKLRNFMTAGLINFPIGESDPIKRLLYCNASYAKLRNSTMPIFLSYISLIMGSYWTKFAKYLSKNRFVTVGISNFPAGFDKLVVNDYRAVDVMFTAGLQGGAAGIGFCALSYGDGYRISVMAATPIMTKEELQQLTKLVIKHVEILHDCSISHAV